MWWWVLSGDELVSASPARRTPCRPYTGVSNLGVQPWWGSTEGPLPAWDAGWGDGGVAVRRGVGLHLADPPLPCLPCVPRPTRGAAACDGRLWSWAELGLLHRAVGLTPLGSHRLLTPTAAAAMPSPGSRPGPPGRQFSLQPCVVAPYQHFLPTTARRLRRQCLSCPALLYPGAAAVRTQGGCRGMLL